MSAQTKLFMDRGLFALFGYKKDVLAGKRIAIAMSYGDTDAFNSQPPAYGDAHIQSFLSGCFSTIFPFS